MMSFGEDLARLVGEIGAGHKSRAAVISEIRMKVQKDRSTQSADAMAARTKWAKSTAEAIAARSADLNARSGKLREMRATNKARIRDDTRKLRQELGAGRRDLTETVAALCETMRTVRAKAADDQRQQLGEGIAKMRDDMQRQFVAARAAWSRGEEPKRASAAPSPMPLPAEPARPPVAASPPPNRTEAPVVVSSSRNERVAPQVFALDIGVRA